MTVFGQTLASFRYDGQGRMTSLKLDDGDFTLNISYSPLKLKFVDEDDVTEWNSVVTNSAGYITSARVTEVYDGETDVYSIAIKYDSNNRMTSTSVEGEGTTATLTWNGSDLESFRSHDGDYSFSQIFSYSDTENRADNVSLMWCEMSPYWITGLFGKVPGHLPSSVTDTSYDETRNFAYKLNSNGTIAKEQVAMDGEGTIVIDYNYSSSRASEESAAADAFKVFDNKSVRKHRLFKKK